MLSLKDFHHKAIIFILSHEAKLKFQNQNLILEDKKTGKIKNQMPCIKIFSVFIIGQITITSVLLEKSKQFGFSIVFLKQNFRLYAFLGAETEGNTLLRSKQYKNEYSITLANYIVKNKIMNQLELLRNIRQKNDTIRHAIERISTLLEPLQKKDIQENDVLLGIEGNCGKIFFSAYFKNIGWHSRHPRTKIDPLNTLMDIGYTFLFNFVESHLKLYGFDLYFGFYHRLFYQRKSLVCDLIEPFRCIIDKSLRKGFTLKQFKNEDFSKKIGKLS